ncbi:MAG: helix-turn-helix domain-containing protein [Ilumatobacter fluminis]|uniref:winged helix-turn-helix domain-containing protein n=1 Tax=Ilumatobacter fluminis TaxID=467091 RepID=UPI0032EFB1A3
MSDDDLDSTWEPQPDTGDPVDKLDLDDLGLLGELTHPMRSRILRSLKQPRTVAEVAEQLDMPVTRLYHHINRLEDLGFIRVVATRRVAAVTERRYQVTAKSFGIADHLFTSADKAELAAALGALFDVAKLQFQREVEHGNSLRSDTNDEHSILSLGTGYYSPDRRDELLSRLREVIGEFDSDLPDDDPEAIRTSVFIAVFPETT